MFPLRMKTHDCTHLTKQVGLQNWSQHTLSNNSREKRIEVFEVSFLKQDSF